ncbi:NAD(P)-dependent oxidoreductase [Hymenobacter chitinivorans]|uniref:Putative NADH-flavin reductase n=1 Tax=Hymenobacter chitinivorans DSM 11115 TaxID=1121954 RepID=A0A2M9BQJ0_9BACT|nr:SDR family oxidoreductase [Hymenobacter chitinivorans]PJJ60230.1 putative NADH-flavin reductase [Hymenobacter chitinivorans DSM 11115]
MNLLIFGATGGTGRQLVAQALDAGHHVTAFARTPAKLAITHPRLRTVQGDVLDYEAVLAAMPGHEAVLSALGAPATQKGAVRSVGTRHILQAMEASQVSRFICLTTLGMGDSRAALPFSYKYFIVPLFLRQAFADSEVQESYIQRSPLAWTIARPATLTDGVRTGTYRHGFPASASGLKIKISRADVADFMLGQLQEPTYLRQAASLSY